MSLLWVFIGSRLDDAYGAGDVDALFHGEPSTVTPFPRAGRRKDRQDYDHEAVRQALLHKPVLTHVDPRTLSSTQPSVTRAGVQHYMGDDYKRTGATFADHGNIGNQHPVVYQREDGTNLILAGHHRAAAALLKGEPLAARVVSGGWPARTT